VVVSSLLLQHLDVDKDLYIKFIEAFLLSLVLYLEYIWLFLLALLLLSSSQLFLRHHRGQHIKLEFFLPPFFLPLGVECASPLVYL